MNVVIPFHNGDAHLAIDLVKWIGQLGGFGGGSLILVTDRPVSECKILEQIEPDKKWLGTVFFCCTENPVQGWPTGSNALFAKTLQYFDENRSFKDPWLWLEPDAIPLKRGWLDLIRKEYESLPTRVGMVPGKWETDTSAKSSPHPRGDRPRYMGNVYVCNNPRLPNRLMSGIGVYPADAKDELIHFTKTQFAWDVEAARFLVENCYPTKLIHHFWGIAGLPPTFAIVRTDSSPPNTFTLDSIHKDAVIFHRNKDGTLMKLLKQLIPMTIPMHEFEILAPIKNDAELIAKIRDSVTDW